MNVDALFIRKISFPRSASLWVLLDRGGVRREVLERGEKHVRRVSHLQFVNISAEIGASKYPILRSIDPSTTLTSAPAWYAFDAWISEMIDIGLPPEDAHPELYQLLCKLDRTPTSPPKAYWGLVAQQIAGIFGIWAPPKNCSCKAKPGANGVRYFCGECIHGVEDKFVTMCGDFFVPLALLLDDIDQAYKNAFDRQIESSNLIRQLGKRGLLTI